MNTFAARLKDLRTQAGLSQEALAARAHISQRTVARLEAGGTPPPRRSTLALIAAALSVSVDELLANGEAA